VKINALIVSHNNYHFFTEIHKLVVVTMTRNDEKKRKREVATLSRDRNVGIVMLLPPANVVVIGHAAA